MRREGGLGVGWRSMIGSRAAVGEAEGKRGREKGERSQHWNSLGEDVARWKRTIYRMVVVAV